MISIWTTYRAHARAIYYVGVVTIQTFIGVLEPCSYICSAVGILRRVDGFVPYYIKMSARGQSAIRRDALVAFGMPPYLMSVGVCSRKLSLYSDCTHRS